MDVRRQGDDSRIRRSRLVELIISDPVRVRNMLSGKERRVNKPLVFALHELSDYHTADTVRSILTESGIPEGQVSGVVRLLLDDATLLIEESAEAQVEETLCENVGWHRITRNQMLSRRHIQFLERADEARVFRSLIADDPPRLEWSLRPRHAGVAHSLPQPTTTYRRTAEARRTGRLFDVGRNLDVEVVAASLASSLMVTSWRDTPFGVRFPLRLTPSCGALNSVGAMVLARRVDGLAPGWYDYDPIDHALCEVDLPVDIPWDHFTYGQRPFMTSAATIALYHRTSLFGWKYQDSSAYDAVCAEAGAVVQAMAVQCAEFGVSVTPTNALRTANLDSLFPVDRYDESYPLFMVAMGYPDPDDDADYSPEILEGLFRA
jgi:SagB-type dehydrogenase family enzyme